MKFKNNNFTRDVSVQLEQSQNKQLVFSICSEEPYLREDETFGPYYQVLEVTPEAINDERLRNGISFLKDHDSKSQLGIVKRWWIANKKLYVSVKFSRSNFAKSLKEDIEEGVRPWCSIGYYVEKFEKTGVAEDGIPILTAKRYSIYEASSVSIPADFTCGFNRELEIKEQKGQDMDAQTDKTDSASKIALEEPEVEETDLDREDQATIVEDLETKSAETTEVEEKEKEKELCPDCNKPLDECECKQKEAEQPKEEEKACGGEMKPQEKALEITKDAIADALTKQIEADAAEIRSLGELTGEQKSAEEFVTQKRSLDQFKTYLKTKNSEKSKNSIQDTKKMNRQYFSISKAIRNACSQYKKDVSEEYETQVIAENKRNLGIEDADVVMTRNEMKQRGFVLAPSGAVGGDLVQQEYLPREYSTYLRPELTLEKTGYYGIDVTGPDISFAVCTSGATANMYSLDDELVDGGMEFGLKTLKPHKCGVCIPIPYSLILQARPDIDAIVEADIVNALYQKRDEEVFVGDGTGNNLTGIVNAADTNQLTGSLSSTSPISGAYGTFLNAENKIRQANIWGNLAIVMNGDDYVKLCATPKNKDNCMAGFVIENDKIKDIPVYINNAVTSGTIIVGDFSQLIVGDFATLSLKVDDITYIKKSAIQVVATMAFDSIIRRPKAFTIITMGD